MMPAKKPTPTSSAERMITRLLTFSSHSRLGWRAPSAGTCLCFSRLDCTRYISPATNPTITARVPASSAMPCTAAQARDDWPAAIGV